MKRVKGLGKRKHRLVLTVQKGGGGLFLEGQAEKRKGTLARQGRDKLQENGRRKLPGGQRDTC